MKNWTNFKEKWVVDYEFYSKPGNPPVPICYVAKNLDTDEIIKHWIKDSEVKPIYSTGNKSLFIAYYASAEIGCHLSLNFEISPYILDLFAEFRCLTNGLEPPCGNGLIGACNYYGISGSDTAYKDSMRDRILQGPPFTEKEKWEILDYCQRDVEMTARLFNCMQSEIELDYALLRGRYMSSVAHMEHYGIPIDVESLQILKNHWDPIKEEIISRVDEDYNVFEGSTFKIAKFERYLQENNIPWESTPSGLPKTDNKYMHEQAKKHPELKPLQELRFSLGQLKLNDLQIGNDGRNRCLLSPFASITSRNQPSTSKFIFGNATWLRFLIKPPKDYAVCYIDYEQQELAIAAALSQDENLIEAYQTGDPYLAFAKAAGAVPPDGTKKSHPKAREKFKICMLALNYGMSTRTFAETAKIPLEEAKLMVMLHKRRFKRYWEWNSGFIDMGLLSGRVETNYHWKYYTKNAKYRTLMNWPMQSTGADILRLAICLCVDNGIHVVAPVHDAILIEDSIDYIDESVKKAQRCMEVASEYFINFKIRTEAKTVRYPDRYMDPRGENMWNNIWEIIDNINPNEIEQRLKEKNCRKKKIREVLGDI
jgi:DNA polymerase I-like protein with 3'-5' exonuclease and polymerase domains